MPAPASRADAVSRLQEALHIQADGTFGPETEAAVKHLQAAHGLAVDGVVGPETWRALGIGEHATLHPPHAVLAQARPAKAAWLQQRRAAEKRRAWCDV